MRRTDFPCHSRCCCRSSNMVRRVAIVTVLMCSVLATLFLPMRETRSWTGEYSIVAVPLALPIQNSETESRKRPLQSATVVQSKRQLRNIPRIVAPAPRHGVTVLWCRETPQRPSPPEHALIPPRAPPVLC